MACPLLLEECSHSAGVQGGQRRAGTGQRQHGDHAASSAGSPAAGEPQPRKQQAGWMDHGMSACLLGAAGGAQRGANSGPGLSHCLVGPEGESALRAGADLQCGPDSADRQWAAARQRELQQWLRHAGHSLAVHQWGCNPWNTGARPDLPTCSHACCAGDASNAPPHDRRCRQQQQQSAAGAACMQA